MNFSDSLYHSRSHKQLSPQGHCSDPAAGSHPGSWRMGALGEAGKGSVLLSLQLTQGY